MDIRVCEFFLKKFVFSCLLIWWIGIWVLFWYVKGIVILRVGFIKILDIWVIL